MTTPTDLAQALPDFAALAKTLGTPDATFDAWRDATADKHWKHFDLSALRIGYELGKAAYGPCAQPESATLYQQLMNTLGAKDQIDAMRILAGHHARELQAQPASVVDGWVMVPREPTREMCLAARRERESYLVKEDAESPVVMYRAMLAAAPQPAKDRPVCNRDCDCVGECKAGVE